MSMLVTPKSLRNEEKFPISHGRSNDFFQKRLRREVEGLFFCTLNRTIDVIEIEHQIEPDLDRGSQLQLIYKSMNCKLQYLIADGSYIRDIIKLRSSPHFAIIKKHYERAVSNVYYLEVLFRTQILESEL